MRILHVVPTYWPAVRYGGPIRSVHALARELAKRGHDVHAFTTNVDGAGESAVPVGRPVDLDGVQVTYFSSPMLRRFYWSPRMACALRVVKSFDLVHLHSVFLWPTWATARAARAAQVPYVLAPRGMLVPKLIRRRSRWAKSIWIALIERHNLASAAAIHATSDLEAQDLAGFGWRLPPIAIIPNGVDKPDDVAGQLVSHDVAAAIASGRFILSLGRIVWTKGLDRLIAALPAVPNVRLVLVGDDPEGHAATLFQKVNQLGVADRVTILARHVEGADKEALLAATCILAMPSLSENFGIAAVDAMRRGRAVLVTPEVGSADLVRQSGGGVVVQGEPTAIAAGLRELLADQRRLRDIGAAGQAYVSAHYDWASIAANVETLYNSILSSRG